MIFALWPKKFRTLPKIYGRVSETSSYVSREKLWKNDDFLVILYFEIKKIGLGAKQFSRDCHNFIRRVQRKIVRVFHWKKRWFFISFCTFSKIIVHFCQTYTAGFRKLQSICPEKKCERDKIWKNDEFLVILYFQWRKLDSGQSNWAGVVKTTFGVSRGILWGFFIEKRMVFHIFLHFEQSHCWLLPNNYGRVSETSIYVFGEKLWEKKKWKEKDDFVVILYFEIKKLDFGQNSLAEVVKAAFGVTRGIFWAFFIGKTMIFELFSHFERKSSGLCQTFTAGFSKLQSTCPEKNFEREKIKKRWFLSNFVLWVRKMDFGQNNSTGFVKAAFGVSRGIFWAFFIGKTMTFERFSHFEQKSSGLCQKSTAGFPKFQTTCPEKNFEIEKFWKNDDFDDFVVILYFE